MGFQKTQTKQNKNKPKCNLGMFRKENRLVSSPECLGLFNPDVMHRLETKQIKEIIVNNNNSGRVDQRLLFYLPVHYHI